MKIKDLKLLQQIEMNGRTWEYRGVNKVRIQGIGKVEKVVFYNSELGEKVFDLKVLNADLKEKDGIIIYKP